MCGDIMACECKKRENERDIEEVKKLDNRINRIIGQLNGIKSMIDENRYCDDILIQLAAIDKSVKSLASIILESHMKECMVKSINDGKLDVIDEIVDLFKRFN